MPEGAERRRILPFLRSKRGTRSAATQGVHTTAQQPQLKHLAHHLAKQPPGIPLSYAEYATTLAPLSGTKGARAQRAGYALGRGGAAANPPLLAERSDAGGSYNRTTTPTETPSPAISQSDCRGIPFHSLKMQRRSAPFVPERGASEASGVCPGQRRGGGESSPFCGAKGGRGAQRRRGFIRPKHRRTCSTPIRFSEGNAGTRRQQRMRRQWRRSWFAPVNAEMPDGQWRHPHHGHSLEHGKTKRSNAQAIPTSSTIAYEDASSRDGAVPSMHTFLSLTWEDSLRVTTKVPSLGTPRHLTFLLRLQFNLLTSVARISRLTEHISLVQFSRDYDACSCKTASSTTQRDVQICHREHVAVPPVDPFLHVKVRQRYQVD